MNVEKIKNEFKKHYKKYDFNDTAIVRKYYHSLRVMELSRVIAKYAKFNDNDAEIAAIVGLLHDYARFEQWTKYKTYRDIDSVDHGDLAVKKLFDDNEIVNYSLKEENYDEIYDAIKYHNKISVPDNLTEHNTLLCKIIRDADKLDIFYLLGINKSLLEEDKESISKEIESDFFDSKCININDAKSKNDLIVLHLAMVFDLNFDYSFKYLLDKNLIWRMYDNIADKKKFKKYFDYVDKYIKRKVRKSC